MNKLQIFLNLRKKEIEQFFQFLEHLKIDENKSYTVSVYGDAMQEEDIFELNMTHTQIFKSNCFLLLYNSIEGTVYKSLSFVIDSINDEGILTHRDVINEIQEIWLKYNLLMNGNIHKIDSVLIEHFQKYIEEKIDINFDHFKNEIKGYFGTSNITDDVIHSEILPKIGINTTKIIEKKLTELKDFRNALAHGNDSFADIGSKVTFNQMVEYKDKTFKYLDKYIATISTYVSDKKYRVS